MAMSGHKEDWEIEFLLFLILIYCYLQQAKVLLLERKEEEWVLCRHQHCLLPYLRDHLMRFPLSSLQPPLFYVEKMRSGDLLSIIDPVHGKAGTEFTHMTQCSGLFPVYANILLFHNLCAEPTQQYWCLFSSPYSPNSICQSPDSGLYLARCCVSFSLKSNSVWLQLENE